MSTSIGRPWRSGASVLSDELVEPLDDLLRGFGEPFADTVEKTHLAGFLFGFLRPKHQLFDGHGGAAIARQHLRHLRRDRQLDAVLAPERQRGARSS